MATKKQQRRRQKERRHEYEVVYLDEEGNEVEAPAATSEVPAKPAKAKPAAASKQARSRRPLREVKPPSWRRSARRALIFGPGILIFLFLVNKNHQVKPAEVVLILAYTALFIPTFYWIDRLAYRRYQRMTGSGPPPTKKS